MKRAAIRSVLLMLVMLVPGPDLARAQTPVARLTLNEAIARGLEASHRIAELDAREAAARAVEDQREAAALPQLSLLASYSRTNHVDEFVVPSATGGLRVIYPDLPNSYRSRVDLQWPIYTGGRTLAFVKAAGAEADALTQDREAARADLKLEITRAYWAVTTARASLEVVRQALNRTDAHLGDVRNQLTVGLVPPSDVLSIEAQRARQQMLSIEAQNVAETTSAEFRHLVGLSPDAPFELADPIQLSPAAPRSPVRLPSVAAPAFKAAVDAALASRPERKSLSIRLDAAVQRVFAAAAARRPLLMATGGYDVARPNPRIFPIQAAWKPSWDLGVNLRWSLFDGGRVRAEIAEADANRRAAEERLRDFDSIVEVEVRQRGADLDSAEASIEAAQAGVRAAAEARRVIAERFAAGVATNTDVLSAQLALLQAELDLTRALANARLALARLDRALGR
jgi:outer membrane protein